MNNFKLTILGSCAAIPALGRFTSCQHLTIQNRHFLIDCGEGAQMQLAKYDIAISKINHIFISHLHGDHHLGLMGLLFSMHLQKRQADLHLYSPNGLNEIILLHLKYSNSSLNYTLHYHPFNPDEKKLIFEDKVLTIETIPLNHKLPCAGFLFKEKEKLRNLRKEMLKDGMLLQHLATLKRGEDVFDSDGKLLYKNEDYTLPPNPQNSYAYCSDTMWNESMIDQIKDVNWLYHEATFMEEEKDKALETKHSTAKQAAQMATLCKAKFLVIGHFSARYRELEPLLAEAKEIFPATSLAIEGKIFDLEL